MARRSSSSCTLSPGVMMRVSRTEVPAGESDGDVAQRVWERLVRHRGDVDRCRLHRPVVLAQTHKPLSALPEDGEPTGTRVPVPAAQQPTASHVGIHT